MVDTTLNAPTPAVPTPPGSLRRYVQRVVQRPRGWLLAYLLTTLPALGLALLTAPALLPFTRYPAFRRMLETRTLDLLPDLFTLNTGNEGWMLLGVLGLLLVLPLAVTVKLIWIWLEGGTLADYAAPSGLSARAFGQAGRRWFGVFLVLNIGGTGLLIVSVGMTLLPALLVHGRFPTLAWGIIGIGLLVAGLCATWIEMARAAALVNDDPHAWRALKRAAGAMRQQWRPLLLLVGGSLLLFGTLFLLQRWLLRLLPLSWWLPTALIQQACAFVRLGIRLTRQAGQLDVLKAYANSYTEIGHKGT